MNVYKNFLLCLYLLTSGISLGQNSATIYVSDFTLNDENFIQGDTYRKLVEAVINEVQPNVQITERDEIYRVLQFVQKENNLYKDLNQENESLIRALEVDFILLGNFELSNLTRNVELQLEFIKVSESTGLLNINLPRLRFSEDEFESTLIFEVKLKALLSQYTLDDKLGVVNTNAIQAIQKDLQEKQSRIEELQEQITAVKDYGDVANTTVWSTEFYVPGSDQIIMETGEIVDLMSEVYKYDKENDVTELQKSDLALQNALKVIELKPRFPFSYAAAAHIYHHRNNEVYKVYAEEAVKIFEYTTMINGHGPHHDEVLNQMRRLLKK